MTDHLRIPPHSTEAEQAVIGGLLLSPKAWHSIADRIKPEDFYNHANRLIFEAVRSLCDAGKPFDAITLGDHFERNGTSDQVGGVLYLLDIASKTPSAANITAYADIVRSKADLRRLIDAGTNIVAEAFTGASTPIDLISTSQRALGDILRDQPLELERPRAILRRLAEEGARRQAGGSEMVGLSTGLPDLDRIFGGMKGGQLIIVAGRPKMGKTTLARQISEHVLLDLGKAVAFHSLEMPPEQLMTGMIASVGGVDYKRLQDWELHEDEWARWSVANQRLNDAPLHVSKPRNCRIEHIVAQTTRTHMEQPLGLVVIDYLQLIDVSGAERRDLGIGECTRQLKLLAGHLDVPIILLSQLNRQLEQRPNKRPMPSDLRDSGSIEQDADSVIFVYRDEVYDPESPDKGTAEIILALARGRQTGMARVASRLDVARFDSLDRDWQPAYKPEPERKVRAFVPRIGNRGKFAAAGGGE